MEKKAEIPDWQRKFEQFWQAWPHRITGSGRAVKMNPHGVEVWFRAKKPDDELFAWLMSSLKQYAAATDKRYIKDADRWLKDWRWQDFDKPKVMPQLPPEIQQQARQIAAKMDCAPKLTEQQEFEQSRQRNLKLLEEAKGPAKEWLQRHLSKQIRRLPTAKPDLTGQPLRADFDGDPELKGGV